MTKVFRTYDRRPGFWGGMRDLVDRRNKELTAVAGIDLAVPAGEIVGYIGPNGAGKSTTIKVMSGILVPDSGTCLIKGRVPWKERKAHVAGIGAVFGQRTQLWWDVPVAESFELLRAIYRIERGTFRKRHDELVEALGAGGLLGSPARSLSLGQRMRCELVASLLHGPDLLFLDEPTIGLDAVSKLAVRDFIARENRERGLTVILTTHDVHDIEALATRVILIGRGSILFDGGFSELLAPHREKGVERALAELYGELGIA
ncbi:MAG TPA: ATP-binding cassette domain-containing protein [Spirochaetales bacterium]|nr:ATP-binding cassette domain-containing protein [Spirochaetales bacterium]